jgi:radical SAM protein with 4Fe4S-binding SPASM domain
MTKNNGSVVGLRRCVVEVTLACNLTCRHCGSRAGKPRSRELTAAELAGLFSQIADLGSRRVTLSGGEPLLRDDWPELVGAAARTGMHVGLITNGTLFDRRAAETARAMGLGSVGFSLDGVDRTHDRIRGRIGHFRAVVTAAEAASGADLALAIVTHLNRWNVGELEQIHDVVRDLGAYAWQVQTGTDMGNLSDHPDLLLRPSDLVSAERVLGRLVEREEVRVATCNSFGYFGPNERRLRRGLGGKQFGGCPAGIRTLGVESSGDVKGCLSLMPGGDERGAAFVEGNVREQALAAIWNRPDAFAYNRRWSAGDLGSFCGECRHAARCRGGCRANAAASGEDGDNRMCVHRAIVEERRGRVRVGQAAAVALASLLSTSNPACGGDEPDTYADSDDGGVDGSADVDTDTDTDTDVDADTDAYDIPSVN